MNKEAKKVLVVEDSPYLAESLKDMLEMAGYQPLIATNGKEGLDLALSEHPDLILLDIYMPDMDGYEVFHSVRKDAWGKDANIAILTASESKDNIAKNTALPPEKVLFKPDWSITELMEKINSWLR